MLLTRIVLANLRNYATLDFAPAPGLNVFVGPNAQGKSNLLEAIALLGTGKSFRTSRESEVIRWGMASASVSGIARLRAGEVRLSCTLTAAAPSPAGSGGANGRRKIYTVNGQSVRYATYLGRARVVAFTPVDLQLVAGPPALRRSMLNAALSQESATYYRALAEYGKQVQQKAALLRGAIAVDATLLAAYNERLVAAGAPLIVARRHYVAALAAAAADAHGAWTAGGGDESLRLRYLSSVPVDDAASTVDVAAAFERRLRALAAAELARKACLVGPHRDDVAFELGGQSLAAYGSQGQQRTAVLAMKIAEYNVLRERGGEAPLLLLDDVLSELDADRQRALLAATKGLEQVFITSTAVPVGVSPDSVYRITAARLEAVA